MPPPVPFQGQLHDCYDSTDPRVNKDLAKQLNGKNVVLAGAGRGVGRACAEVLSYGELKSLSLVALEQDELDETAKLCSSVNSSTAIKTRVVDVKDPRAVEEFLKDVEQDFGGIDVLLMNAGRPPQWLPTAEGDPNIWWDTVTVSLQGAYNFSRYALPIMQKNGGGRIIFTASAGAHANIGGGSYIISKLGMVRLAEIIHVENYKQHNIKTFAIHPGAIQTRFFHDFKNKVEGQATERSYIVEGAEGEEKSAATAVGFFEGATWDTPYMSAGMVAVLATGQLDFMSGRYVDCSVKIEEFERQKEDIVKEDLHRVRLNAGDGHLVPTLDY